MPLCRCRRGRRNDDAAVERRSTSCRTCRNRHDTEKNRETEAGQGEKERRRQHGSLCQSTEQQIYFAPGCGAVAGTSSAASNSAVCRQRTSRITACECTCTQHPGFSGTFWGGFYTKFGNPPSFRSPYDGFLISDS